MSISQQRAALSARTARGCSCGQRAQSSGVRALNAVPKASAICGGCYGHARRLQAIVHARSSGRLARHARGSRCLSTKLAHLVVCEVALSQRLTAIERNCRLRSGSSDLSEHQAYPSSPILINETRPWKPSASLQGDRAEVASIDRVSRSSGWQGHRVIAPLSTPITCGQRRSAWESTMMVGHTTQ